MMTHNSDWKKIHKQSFSRLDSCVAKKKCFAPAALYKPFGEQAAGVRSLAQFQALQDGEKELDSLRELGLTDPEIELWRNRDVPDSGGKVRVKPDVLMEYENTILSL